ncbi:helix-turn-helix transcriptional regulator [Catenulispora yoronensis]|uniref:Helix-turn-helix transcriptional regulator n=1 Tax=Catenulispora yoronensis TaxID=450799 RepID=A0ABP5GX23_9ACTN
MSENRLHLSGPTRHPLSPGELVDWHDHDVNQLCYPLHGILEVATPLGVWIVPPHRAAWIPAAVPHAHRAHGPTEMLTLIFPAAINPLQLDRPTVLAVDPLLREVIAVLTKEDLGAAQRRNLERVALDRLRRVGELPLCLPWPTDDRVRTVARILADDPADPRTLAELGRVAGAGERTLSRLFRAETGMTFPQWRAQVRLQHALALLAGGESVTGVATACGFPTPSAFIETFRKALGTTPGRYVAGVGIG